MRTDQSPTGLDLLPAPYSLAVDYAVDAWQRGVLFLDVLRQRGNQYHEHMAQQAPNVLRYETELLLDGH
ncbi:DUF3141 domain-containing protein, partial [Klebsiella pneumoniae]|nr:DUF3141 domain-containing protein [Klebsiella pneumoniae]